TETAELLVEVGSERAVGEGAAVLRVRVAVILARQDVDVPRRIVRIHDPHTLDRLAIPEVRHREDVHAAGSEDPADLRVGAPLEAYVLEDVARQDDVEAGIRPCQALEVLVRDAGREPLAGPPIRLPRRDLEIDPRAASEKLRDRVRGRSRV